MSKNNKTKKQMKKQMKKQTKKQMKKQMKKQTKKYKKIGGNKYKPIDSKTYKSNTRINRNRKINRSPFFYQKMAYNNIPIASAFRAFPINKWDDNKLNTMTNEEIVEEYNKFKLNNATIRHQHRQIKKTPTIEKPTKKTSIIKDPFKRNPFIHIETTDEDEIAILKHFDDENNTPIELETDLDYILEEDADDELLDDELLDDELFNGDV